MKNMILHKAIEIACKGICLIFNLANRSKSKPNPILENVYKN